MAIEDIALSADIQHIAPRGILVRNRIITPGDEDALDSIEALPFRRSVVKVRRQSGAVRIAARQLARQFGVARASFPRSATGAPMWPVGLVGSFSHDDTVAIAAMGRCENYSTIGIDVEPATPLPPELVEIVATTAEQTRYSREVLASRVLFAAKEAVFKALNPIENKFLDFHDIEIHLNEQVAIVRHEIAVRVSIVANLRVVALAYIYQHE